MIKITALILVLLTLTSFNLPEVFARNIRNSPTPIPAPTPKSESEILNQCLTAQSQIKVNLISYSNLLEAMNLQMDNIYARALKYYASKFVRTGKNIENYTRVKSALDEQKNQVKDIFRVLRELVGGFDCSGDNRLEKYKALRESLKVGVMGSMNYKLQLKNFLLEMRSLENGTQFVPQTQTSAATGSSKPATASPSATPRN